MKQTVKKNKGGINIKVSGKLNEIDPMQKLIGDWLSPDNKFTTDNFDEFIKQASTLGLTPKPPKKKRKKSKKKEDWGMIGEPS